METSKQISHETHEIEFSLFAPGIKWVALHGDFTDWQAREMTKGDDGYFRTKVKLADGHYQYKFEVESGSKWLAGKRVFVIDPLATEIDAYNELNAILHIRNGQRVVDEYQWQHEQNNLPGDTELVLYEMNVRDFAGSFQGVIEKLDYLVDLGINAIEMLPVAANPPGYSWGYNVLHFCAVEPALGTATNFKRLIDECHARGIRLILDMVFNHSQLESPLTQIDYTYWYKEHNTDEVQFGPKFDYERFDEKLKVYPARQFGREVVTYWTREFHLDGIRFDGTYLIANFDFLREVGEAAQQVVTEKPFLLIAEHIPVNPAIIGPDMPMQALWNNNFLYQIGANLVEKKFGGWEAFDWDKTLQAIEPVRMDVPGAIGSVDYLSNHDQHHFFHELDLNGVHGDKAFRKGKLAFAISMTAVGLPLIWMGEEFGDPSTKDLSPRPIHFELLRNQPNCDLFNYVKRLAAFRKTTGALHTDKIEFLHQDETNRILVWKRWDEAGSVVVSVINFTDTPFKDYHIPNFPAGQWQEITLDYTIETTSQGGLTEQLGPSEARIYRQK